MKFLLSLFNQNFQGHLWLLLLATLVIGLFGVTLTVGFFTPIYFDDIGHIISGSRSGYDGWEATNLQPLCISNSSVPIPASLLPGRSLSWLLHSITYNFVILRLHAVIIFILWLA